MKENIINYYQRKDGKIFRKFYKENDEILESYDRPNDPNYKWRVCSIGDSKPLIDAYNLIEVNEDEVMLELL